MSTTMKAVVAKVAGPPEVMVYADVEKPRIQRITDALVRVVAAGVNPGDCQIRRAGPPPYAAGEMQVPYSILGMDGVGVVEAVGSDVTNVRPGDEVWYYDGGYANHQGSYAQFKVLDARYLAPKPVSLDFLSAAALPVVGLTALEAVFDRANVQAGSFVLVHGGAGGIGHIGIQLAKLRGARVATTISDDRKRWLAHSLGAELLIDYRLGDVKRQIEDWSGKEGADVVFDFVGGPNFANSIDLVAPYGALVNTVVSDWPAGNNLIAEYKNLSIQFVNIGLPQVSGHHEFRLRQTSALAQLSRLVDAGKLRVHLDRVYQLKDVAQAHRALEAGEIVGRVVVHT